MINAVSIFSQSILYFHAHLLVKSFSNFHARFAKCIGVHITRKKTYIYHNHAEASLWVGFWVNSIFTFIWIGVLPKDTNMFSDMLFIYRKA